MAAIRGRAITTFGGLFTSLGLDGGSIAPSIVAPGNRLVIVHAESRIASISGESRVVRMSESPRIDRVT